MIADIFISHASRDRDPARTLCEALENRGFGCWMASRDIGPGENFQVAIVRAIRAAKVMILVFSSNSNNSEEIKKELVLAGQSQLIVIPVRVEDVTPDEAFAYELAIRQWIDLFDDWERAVQRLVRQLEAVVGIKRTLPPEAEPQHSPNLTRTMQATSASAAEQNFSSATEVAKATMPAVPPTFTLSNEAAPSAAPSAEDTGGAPTSPASPVPGNASPTTEVSSFRSTETANGTVPPSTTRTVLRLAVPAAVIVPIVTALIGGGVHNEPGSRTRTVARPGFCDPVGCGSGSCTSRCGVLGPVSSRAPRLGADCGATRTLCRRVVREGSSSAESWRLRRGATLVSEGRRSGQCGRTSQHRSDLLLRQPTPVHFCGTSGLCCTVTSGDCYRPRD